MMIKKIKNCGGFSLAETLVALIIILLVSSVIAAGMPVAQKAYVNVIESANAQMFLSTTLTELRNELATASDINFNGTKASVANPVISGDSISYTNPITGDSIILLAVNELGENRFYITTYRDIQGSNPNPGRALVSDKAKTGGLSIELLPPAEGETNSLFTYNALTGVVTVGAFKVKSSNSQDAAELEQGYTIQVLPPEILS